MADIKVSELPEQTMFNENENGHFYYVDGNGESKKVSLGTLRDNMLRDIPSGSQGSSEPDLDYRNAIKVRFYGGNKDGGIKYYFSPPFSKCIYHDSSSLGTNGFSVTAYFNGISAYEGGLTTIKTDSTAEWTIKCGTGDSLVVSTLGWSSGIFVPYEGASINNEVVKERYMGYTPYQLNQYFQEAYDVRTEYGVWGSNSSFTIYTMTNQTYIRDPDAQFNFYAIKLPDVEKDDSEHWVQYADLRVYDSVTGINRCDKYANSYMTSKSCTSLIWPKSSASNSQGEKLQSELKIYYSVLQFPYA